MRWMLIALSLLAGPALADDPAGTTPLTLEIGATKKLSLPPGGRIICDDTSVVAAETGATTVTLRGLKIGTTLCGVRGAGETAAGVYRITVVEAKPEEP